MLNKYGGSMFRLNNELLTIEGIIAAFKKDVINKKEPAPGNDTPSLLDQFKTKLKNIYFDKNSTDNVIRAALEHEARFVSDYPELKAALHAVFLSDKTTNTDKTAILTGLEASRALRLNTKERAQSQWAKLTADLGYFNETPDVFPLFNELANACRAMIVLIEKNNTPDDTMAYTYAYRLMALFVDQTKSSIPDLATIAKSTEDLLNKTAINKKGTPYHDVLLNQVSLPVARDVKDMPGWREFIAKNQKDNMVSTLRFFAMAPAIEKQIEKERKTDLAPKTLTEATAMAARCHYARGAENPELATLCRDANVPENGDECSFNKCLDYLKTVSWPIKLTDSLPHPEIKGEGEAAGYYWVKLPTNDLRALILGRITSCCQSIGGDSEQCVKDAVSLPDNGLYVLLKLKSSKPQDSHPFAADKSINYQAFEIVGQSYGWISNAGNLTLDSFEHSIGRVSTAVARTMLTTFATRVLQDNPTIKFVTLGKGGGTPSNIGFHQAPISETIRSGYDYGDSKKQYCIASTPFSSITDSQRATLNDSLKDYSVPFRNCMNYLLHYLTDTDHVPERVLELLKTDPTLVTELNPESLNRLLHLTKIPNLNDLVPVDVEALEKMTPNERNMTLMAISTAQLIWREKTPDNLLRTLQYVPVQERFATLQLHNYLLVAVGRDPKLIVAMLNLFPIAHHLEVVKEKNEMGYSVLLVAATQNVDAESLIAILSSLPESQRLEALKEKNKQSESVLQTFTQHNKRGLIAIITLLPEKQRLEALMDTNYSGDTILHMILMYTNLIATLNLLPEEHRLEAMMKKNKNGDTILHCVAGKGNPDDLIALLNLLPEAQRLKAMNEKNSDGDTLMHLVAAGDHPQLD